MQFLWVRLSDKGKSWRHVYKSLLLIEYMIKAGSERIIDDLRDNVYRIRTLTDFQHVNEMGKDEGQNVREKAKSVLELIGSTDRIREEREKHRRLKNRSSGISNNTRGFGSQSSSMGTGFDSYSGRSTYDEPYNPASAATTTASATPAVAEESEYETDTDESEGAGPIGQPAAAQPASGTGDLLGGFSPAQPQQSRPAQQQYAQQPAQQQNFANFQQAPAQQQQQQNFANFQQAPAQQAPQAQSWDPFAGQAAAPSQQPAQQQQQQQFQQPAQQQQQFQQPQQAADPFGGNDDFGGFTSAPAAAPAGNSAFPETDDFGGFESAPAAQQQQQQKKKADLWQGTNNLVDLGGLGGSNPKTTTLEAAKTGQTIRKPGESIFVDSVKPTAGRTVTAVPVSQPMMAGNYGAMQQPGMIQQQMGMQGGYQQGQMGMMPQQQMGMQQGGFQQQGVYQQGQMGYQQQPQQQQQQQQPQQQQGSLW